jgi:hypothetical protein
VRTTTDVYQLWDSREGRPSLARSSRKLHGDGGREPGVTLLGTKGLGIEGDYHTAKMPPVNDGLLTGQLAWRQHDGGHTDAPNMKYFIQWSDKLIGHTPPHRSAKRPFWMK